jgi:hypothetical protein
MRRWKQAVLIALLTPVYLVAFTVVHETGHTLLARLLGDPDSTFYLVRVGPGGRGLCLGCNITDHGRLTPAGNLVVSVGGLLATQAVALLALLGRRYASGDWGLRRLVTAIALGFAFLDVPVQAIQGLLYDIERQTWPTGVDLVDAMLLISAATGVTQAVLKTILALLAVAYLAFVWWSYRRSRTRSQASAARLAA